MIRFALPFDRLALRSAAAIAGACAFVLGGNAAQAADPIKLCSVDDRSGPTADAGNEAYNSMMMVVDPINEKGGIGGHKIEVIVYDGKTDPQLSATLATRCADDDKGLIIFGGVAAVPAAAVVPVATQYQTPYFMYAAGTDSLTDPPAPFHFRFGPSNKQDAVAIADLVASQGFKRIAILNNSLPFGTDGSKSVTAPLEERGVKIVAHETYDVSAVDLSPQVVNVRQAKPEMVLMYCYPADCARITRTMSQMGIKLPMIISRVALLDNFRKLAGETADGILSTNTVDLSRSDVQKFFTDYNKRYKPAPPSFLPILGYDAATLAVKILSKPEVLALIDQGKLAETRKAIRDAVETDGQFQGLQGHAGVKYQFSKMQHQGPPDKNWFAFSQVAEGGTKLVPPDLGKFKPAP